MVNFNSVPNVNQPLINQCSVKPLSKVADNSLAEIYQKSVYPKIEEQDPFNQLSSAQGLNKSKYNFNTDSHEVTFAHEQTFGAERAELIHTVEKIIDQYNCKLNFLRDRKQTIESELLFSFSTEKKLSDELNKVNKEIEWYENFVKNAIKHLHNPNDSNCTWLTSQFFDEKIALDIWNYEDRIAGYFPGGPINLHYHEFREGELGERKIGFARCGAIADFSNPFTNLKELRAFAQKSAAEREEILQKFAHIPDTPLNKAKQPIDYMRSPNLSDIVAKREIYLSEQMLQLIETQVEKSSLDFENPLRLFHLGLMNENNTDGNTFHEGNFIQDMQTIFQDFNGKTLIFDGKGPFIDHEGNIHLSKNFDGKRIALQTHFANISVQGNLKKYELQNRTNQETLDQFLEIAPESKKPAILELKQKLASGNSSSALARDFLRIALDLGLISSTGCRKGKDRTGLVCGLVTRDYLNDVIENSSLSPSKKKELKNKFADSLLSEDSVASWIVWKNTKIVVLKITAFTISGVSYFKRLHYYLKQTGLVIDMAKIGLRRKLKKLPSFERRDVSGIFQRIKKTFHNKVHSLLESTSSRVSRTFKRIWSMSTNLFQKKN